MKKKKIITISIDAELEEKMRIIQSNLISSTYSGWSFSSVANLIIEEGVKKFPSHNQKNKK